MFLLAFHIVAVGLVMAVTGYFAYGYGLRQGERRAKRRLEQPDP